eukprot:TRINITY_DN98268_c0_g1_i1.p2 TRINITY_DN98268_c0_g1~~TRINITY_DN98268_c0_g1_i1.p2  ORF type:complete len:208 (+),score=28.19 TRINITY_DN98268_c0_g1_i1:44-625(+)
MHSGSSLSWEALACLALLVFLSRAGEVPSKNRATVVTPGSTDHRGKKAHAKRQHRVWADGSILREEARRAHIASKYQNSPEHRDCTWGEWSMWTHCTQSCGVGERVRARAMLASAPGSGQPCKTADGEETGSCSLQPCPVDCYWDEWTEWTECDAFCGVGNRSRHRRKHLERHGGEACLGNWSVFENCIEQEC